MRKITSLLMLLCLSIGMALAQLPVVSQAPSNGKWAEGTKWYTIKRNNTNPIALSNADANGYLKLDGTSTKLIDGCWCVVGNEANGYQFYNLQAGTTQTLGAYGSEANGRMKMYDLDVTTDGSNTLTKTFDIKTLDGKTYAFVKNHGSTNDWWNERSGYLAYWNSSNAYSEGCTGSQYTFEEVDVTLLVDAYKTNAKVALDMVSFLNVADEKAAIDAVATTNCNAFAEIDAIVNGVAQYVAIRNSHTDSRANHFLGVDMTKGKGNGHGTFDYLLDVWSLKYDGAGAFYLYNVNNEVYLGTPSSNGVLTVTPTAGYTFEVVEGNKVKLKLDGQTLHLNNHAGNGPIVSTGWFLSNFDDVEKGEPASQWYVESNFTSLVASYKAAAIAALDGGITNVCTWLGVDASLVSTAKTAINAIATTDYPTFAAIDAKFNDLAEAIAAKNVVFQNSNTEHANRSEVYLATNMNTNKGRGIKTFDYSAVWNLQFARLDAFYLYNPVNEVYLGKPSDGGSLTDVPVSAYTFELIENNKVELKCAGQTLHVSNNAECTLINHDGNESASRWYVTTFDIFAEIQELINANESNNAETPALGQYSKAGYDALVTAKSTAKTAKDVDAAIAAFKASKNLPVFTISGTKDYVVGKSIYDNNSGTLYFKATNTYDKSMWWAFDQTTTTVGVTNEVVVTNVGTGKNFWGANFVKITETTEAIEDDGIFLLYTEGTGNTVHFQKDNQVMVRYNSTEATSGSAMTFTYIGNSYDLAQLSDELFTAAAELAAVNVPNFSFAAGVNNYNEATKPALDAAIANRAEVLGKRSTAEEIAAAKSQLETAIDGVAINMPVNGKFYRVRCAGNGKKYLQSDLDDSNAKDIRLKVLTDATSVAATFCYVDGTLVSYTTGKSINAYRYDAVGTKSAVVFSEASNGKLGTYNITIGGRYIFGASDDNKIDSGSGTPDNRDGYTWWLEEVNEIPVTISEACYATFYSPVAVTLPEGEGLTAYTVSDQSATSATLEEVGDVIPASTGVLLYADVSEPTTYDLTIGGEDPGVSSLMEGTVASAYIQGPAFILGYVNVASEGEPEQKEVAFYNVILDQEENKSFINNGFKAYLPASPVTGNARFITFDFGTETAIDELNGENGNVKTVIYDLAGRRVQKVQKGVFIVNGKVVIK